jgi:hypothetical chaperone protein
MSTPVCGIDFGTSNSTAGLFTGGTAKLCALEGSENTIPSAIFIDDDSTRSFGRAAVKAYTRGDDGRFMRALKSILGTDLARETTRVGTRQVAFTDILASFIGDIKSHVDAQAGQELTSATIGRPVFFIDGDKEADQNAQNMLEDIVKSTGFKNVTFLPEPLAAAYTYEDTLKKEELALIIDLGGGTSDFSLIRLSPKNKHKENRAEDILSNHGVHIGGTDFDKVLSLMCAMPELGHKGLMRAPFAEKDIEIAPWLFFTLATWPKIHTLYNQKTVRLVEDTLNHALEPDKLERYLNVLEDESGHTLAMKVEETKIALSASDAHQLDMNFVEKGLNVPVSNSQHLKPSLMDSCEALNRTVQETLDDAGVTAEQVSSIFLTGGSTKLPMIRESLLKPFPHAHVVTGDAFGSVGVGLTLHASRYFK